jgi:hypothetical protein
MPLRRDEVTGRVSAQGQAYANRNDAQINNDIHVRYCFTKIRLLSSPFFAAGLREFWFASRSFASLPSRNP